MSEAFATETTRDVAATAHAAPTTDVRLLEDFDSYQVIANLRGVADEDVTIIVRDGVLTIVGDGLASSSTDEDEHVPSTGPFRYSIALPSDADVENVACDFGDDEVTVTIGRPF